MYSSLRCSPYNTSLFLQNGPLSLFTMEEVYAQKSNHFFFSLVNKRDWSLCLLNSNHVYSFLFINGCGFYGGYGSYELFFSPFVSHRSLTSYTLLKLNFNFNTFLLTGIKFWCPVGLVWGLLCAVCMDLIYKFCSLLEIILHNFQLDD